MATELINDTWQRTVTPSDAAPTAPDGDLVELASVARVEILHPFLEGTKNLPEPPWRRSELELLFQRLADECTHLGAPGTLDIAEGWHIVIEQWKHPASLPWAHVELFGDQELVGRIREVQWLGQAFLEVVRYELAPGQGRSPTCTGMSRYAALAVFGIHPLEESEALRRIRRTPTPEEMLELLLVEHGWPEPASRLDVLEALRTYARYVDGMDRIYESLCAFDAVGDDAYFLLRDLSSRWKQEP